jgi:O-antigen biosynthesis protein WbqP
MRRFSLDELPQLINIIKQEMSIVGPRPALWNQHDLIAERDKYGANELRPGLTGLAQIKGRDELPIEQKAKYDGAYAENASFLFDAWVIFKTIVAVIGAHGVKEGGK